MALVLSSSQSSTFEPFRKNRWVMQFTEVPGTTGNEEGLAFVAHTAARPSISFSQVEHQRLNERFYVAGKPTWNELPMTFFDFIKGTSGKLSASEILWSWSQEVYSPVTGQMGFKNDYAVSGTLALLDPSGGVKQVWNLFYCWPASVDWGDLSADDDGLCEVSVTFRYDYAVKGAEA
jgi:hypothetical protein